MSSPPYNFTPSLLKPNIQSEVPPIACLSSLYTSITSSLIRIRFLSLCNSILAHYILEYIPLFVILHTDKPLLPIRDLIPNLSVQISLSII
nr:MAG TPA: hypothetical protein [Caudoviricetes sp.]